MKKLEVFVILVIFIVTLIGCNNKVSSIGIIGGADGPTSVFVGEVQNKEASEAEVVSVEHEPIENNSWGITFEVDEVSKRGLYLLCNQSNGEAKGELCTGSYYIIEKWSEEFGWQEAEWIPQKYPVAWSDEAWGIQKNDVTVWRVDWDNLYGELSAGKYRIGKKVIECSDTGDYNFATFYAEFLIEE